jgi:hypothetical protein
MMSAAHSSRGKKLHAANLTSRLATESNTRTGTYPRSQSTSLLALRATTTVILLARFIQTGAGQRPGCATRRWP